jgi:hypothetical protein
MVKSLKILATTALLSMAAGAAMAAPANMSQIPAGLSDGLTPVAPHRYERTCRRGPGGWYRWGRDGRRHACRQWRGEGRRPDSCVKFGPIWWCDY